MIDLLLEDRVDFLRGKYLPLIKSKLPQFQIPADIRLTIDSIPGASKEEKLFNWLVTKDPTKNKQYLQWILGCAIDRMVPFEDIDYLRGSLEDYHNRKRTNLLPPEARDINSIKTPSQLDKLLRKVENSEASADASETAAARHQSQILLDNSEWLVLIPKTEFAAQYWGRETEWCTAWGDPKGRYPTRHCRFADYTRKGPLYIVIPKNQDYSNAGERYQFQFTTSQYMDENDQAISIVDFMQEKYPALGNWLLRRPDVAENLTPLVAFVPDSVLQTLSEKIYQLVEEHYLWELMDRWMMEDSSYWEWLREKGYEDEDGNVDWDRAPSYMEFNPVFNSVEQVINISAKKIRDLAQEGLGQGDESDVRVDQLERLLADNVRESLGREWRELSDWIRNEVHIEPYTQGKAPKVSVI